MTAAVTTTKHIDIDQLSTEAGVPLTLSMAGLEKGLITQAEFDDVTTRHPSPPHA